MIQIRSDFEEIYSYEVKREFGFPPEPDDICVEKRRGREEVIHGTCPAVDCFERGMMKRTKDTDCYYRCRECGQDIMVKEWEN